MFPCFHTQMFDKLELFFFAKYNMMLQMKEVLKAKIFWVSLRWRKKKKKLTWVLMTICHAFTWWEDSSWKPSMLTFFPQSPSYRAVMNLSIWKQHESTKQSQFTILPTVFAPQPAKTGIGSSNPIDPERDTEGLKNEQMAWKELQTWTFWKCHQSPHKDL